MYTNRDSGFHPQGVGRAVPVAKATTATLRIRDSVRCRTVGFIRSSLPRPKSLKGVSLIELIMFIVIISFALTGIMLVSNQTVGHSADTLLRKQALAAAESLLEEIEARPFSGGTVGSVTKTNRQSPHIVLDYNNFATSGVFDIGGTAVSGLGSYYVAVSVASHVMGGLPQADAMQITVTVTPPAGSGVAVTGYRTNY